MEEYRETFKRETGVEWEFSNQRLADEFISNKIRLDAGRLTRMTTVAAKEAS